MKRALGVLVPVIALIVVGILAFRFIGGEFGPSASLRIISGSENKALEPIVTAWGAREGVDVEMVYMGSVDISRAIGQEARDFDAVWPAHSLWIELGDTERRVKHRESILRSPIVLGLKKRVADRLGWVGRSDVTIAEIREAASQGAFRLGMTSATQSNSGASAYIGFLHAAAGSPDALTIEHLGQPDVRAEVSAFLAQIDRSSGSSGWLKDAYLTDTSRLDAIINYEAMVIEANQALATRGEDPLYVVYPADGLAVADSPLGYLPRPDSGTEEEEAFLALQQYLLSEEVQEQLVALGRRAGLIGLAGGGDTSVWNPAWGIDLDRAIAPIPTPSGEVVREALTLYQTALRKPSLTVWVLDVSGSMEGEPLAELKQAMSLLLDPATSALNLLQPTAADVTVVIPFNHTAEQTWIIEGADQQTLNSLNARIATLGAGGGTDLYRALGRAFQVLDEYADTGELYNFLPAVVAMTDGASDEVNRDWFLESLGSYAFGRDVPIHAIAFGRADEQQLRQLNEETVGRLFHASKGLAGALRKAKGYN